MFDPWPPFMSWAAKNAELSSLVGLTVPDWPIGEMYLPEVTADKFSPLNRPGL
jgi:hypothetical protein